MTKHGVPDELMREWLEPLKRAEIRRDAAKYTGAAMKRPPRPCRGHRGAAGLSNRVTQQALVDNVESIPLRQVLLQQIVEDGNRGSTVWISAAAPDLGEAPSGGLADEALQLPALVEGRPHDGDELHALEPPLRSCAGGRSRISLPPISRACRRRRRRSCRA